MSDPTGARRTGEEVLGRVLGPAAPELTCDECFEEIDRFVELEIASGDADVHVPGMRAHLAGCPACAEEYRSLMDLLADA
jgi:hypothetical protein